MGATVGLTIGFIFGSYSILRYVHTSVTVVSFDTNIYDLFCWSGGAGPRGSLATLSQYMLSSAATFSFFLAIGSVRSFISFPFQSSNHEWSTGNSYGRSHACPTTSSGGDIDVTSCDTFKVWRCSNDQRTVGCWKKERRREVIRGSWKCCPATESICGVDINFPLHSSNLTLPFKISSGPKFEGVVVHRTNIPEINSLQ
jgi:hypothetical protein